MLGWVVTFLIIGLIAAVLGFGGLAGASFAAAKIIFFVAIILLLLSIVFTQRTLPNEIDFDAFLLQILSGLYRAGVNALPEFVGSAFGNYGDGKLL